MPYYLCDEPHKKVYQNIRMWYNQALNLRLYEYASNIDHNDRIIVTKDRKIMFRCALKP
jgi:hypothetical protein